MNKRVREEEWWRRRWWNEEKRQKLKEVGDGTGWVEARAGSWNGETELRGILKTFAILLIFFLKWVKLFYDFRRSPSPLCSFSLVGWEGRGCCESPLNLIQRASPARSRHREKRNSLFVSFSPPTIYAFSFNFGPALSSAYDFSHPFLSRLLYATGSISHVFSYAFVAPFLARLFANCTESFHVFRALTRTSRPRHSYRQLIISFSTTAFDNSPLVNFIQPSILSPLSDNCVVLFVGSLGEILWMLDDVNARRVRMSQEFLRGTNLLADFIFCLRLFVTCSLWECKEMIFVRYVFDFSNS